MTFLQRISLCSIFLMLFIWPLRVLASEPQNGQFLENSRWLLDALSIDFKNLTYISIQRPIDSIINLNNSREINRLILESDFRPDFKADFSRVDLILKPRWDVSWEQCEDGICDGNRMSGESSYIQEWLTRFEPVEGFFISYGREDLQWGPSFLLSPSNPFYTENGRGQPKQEVAGAEYARAVWVPNFNWTGSIIVNTGKGRKEQLPGDDFNKIYALKLDYLAYRGYLSLILSKEETKDYRAGFNISWNISDPTILYAEGSVADEPEILIGTSYTTQNGTMFSLEYFYNGDGNSDDELLQMIFSGDLPDSRQLLFRKNYIMGQFHHQDLLKRWEILLRATINLDDDSSALFGQLEYNLNDNSKLFANGTYYTGDKNDEYGLLYEYQTLAGIEFFF